ncbi:MAG: rhomboid family intramembrane serine protease [Fimbriimonadaceae bacterium]
MSREGKAGAAPFWPAVTWTIIALNIIIFVWDREGAISGSRVVFADLGMRPRAVIQSLGSALSFPQASLSLATLFTSQFLHSDLFHLATNMIMLALFGPRVEKALGGLRFAIYFLFWGVMAGLAQLFVEPWMSSPVLGASGAIGGVLGAHLLLFPAERIRLSTGPSSLWLPVWTLLLGWFVWQVFFPGDGVAGWAHAGGFAAGMLTVIVVGGREKVLGSRKSLATESQE